MRITILIRLSDITYTTAFKDEFPILGSLLENGGLNKNWVPNLYVT